MESRRSGRAVVDPTRPPLEVTSPLLNEMYEYAIKACSERQEECCGLLVGEGAGHFLEVHACHNDMNRHHRRDPFNYPRDARQAFHMRETDYQRVAREAEERGLRVTGIYHSHVNAEVYFSELDQEFASQPLFPFPDVHHLVISVTGDGASPPLVVGVGAFRWLPAEGRFEGVPVRPIAP